jgi:hypothetical protein
VRGRYLFKLFAMGHDVGLAMIYGPVLGAWLFPVAYSLHGFLHALFPLRGNALYIALGTAVLMAFGFTYELLRFDGSLPGQVLLQVGKLDSFGQGTGELKMSYVVRGVPRSVTWVPTTDAFKEELKEKLKGVEAGREIKARYRKTVKTDAFTEERKEHLEIIGLEVRT